MKTRQHPTFWLLIISVTSVLIYLPGLDGAFLLDDYPNLKKLELINASPTLDSYFAYIFNGISSTLGRPISLATLALQADAWPSNPYAFKLGNLIIHLVNGLLVFLLCRQILRISFPSRKTLQQSISLLCAFIWLIHPMQVSTVLYVVQRMTELAATFTLLGLVLYLHGRTLIQTDTKRGLFIMSAGIGGGVLLGVLSKENAILICLYALVLERTIVRTVYSPVPRAWNFVFLYAPLLLLFVYLSPNVIEHLDKHYPIRAYSAVERGLTEGRVLVDYLLNIIAPRPNSFGLIHSDYSISRGLFQPASTFFSLVGLGLLLILALIIRKRQPLIALGILWFFAGHILESSVLNLELYFEHRNYLPLLGIIITTAAIAVFIHDTHFSSQRLRLVYALSLLLWACMLSFITFKESLLWGDPVRQAAVWADAHPRSHRAQGYYGNILTKFGMLHQAKELYERNIVSMPDNPANGLLWLELRCVDKSIPSPDVATLEKLAREGNYYNVVLMTLDELYELKFSGKCPAVNIDTVDRFTQHLMQNTNYAQSKKTLRSLNILASKGAKTRGDMKAATEYLNAAYLISASPDILITVAQIHLAEGNIQWFRQTIDIINGYCRKHPLACLEHKGSIEKLEEYYTDSN